jgi:hypothetical protein
MPTWHGGSGPHLMRGDPGNVHTWGLSIHERKRGSGKLDSGQTNTGSTREFTQVRPSEGKDLPHACLTLYWCGVITMCLQRGRRLDLAGGGEISRLWALEWRQKGFRETILEVPPSLL